MENLDNIGLSSLEKLARNNLSAENKRRLTVDILTGIAGIAFLAAGLVYQAIFKDRTVPAVIYTVGFVIESAPIFVEAVRGILTRNLTHAMEILVAIAVCACFFTGQLELALLIPVILNVSHLLEERSIMGGREAIEALKGMRQDHALLIKEDGSEERTDASSLVPGQLIRIKPGAGIPVDGKVISGESNIDQKSLTGEPEPVTVGDGDTIYAGTVNLDGTLTVEVTRAYNDTSFANILRLLEQSEGISIAESRLLDRFMAYYIPLVLAIAAGVALINSDFSRAIAILVVSCPCGQMLVVSAPMVAALSAATRRGILIKNSKFIEEVNEASTVVFDKTGTLTVGEMRVTGVVTAEGCSDSELLRYASALSQGSDHPIARAVSEYVSGKSDEKAACLREYPGCGLEGTLSSGEKVFFGKKSWIEEEAGCAVPDDFASSETGSVSYIVCDGKLIGAVVLGDRPRDDARETVSELRSLGIDKTVMLTGDRRASAERVREATGVDEVIPELMPEEKLERLRALRDGGKVIAVGDGINDALALKEADIGIAMGAMGSDLAIQSADIALMNNNLTNIPFIIRLSGKTKRIIYQNFALSFTVSAVMILLSSFGIISPVAGAILHNIGAFSVLINSSRIIGKK